MHATINYKIKRSLLLLGLILRYGAGEDSLVSKYRRSLCLSFSAVDDSFSWTKISLKNTFTSEIKIKKRHLLIQG